MTIETAGPRVIYADLGAPAAVIVHGRHGALVVADPHVTAPHLAAAVTTAAVLRGEYTDQDLVQEPPPTRMPLPRTPEEKQGDGSR